MRGWSDPFSRQFFASKCVRVVVTTTGGARIQEGMVALSMMARTALAVSRLQEAGVPFICLLADPTMGGVFVSFASLADVLLADKSYSDRREISKKSQQQTTRLQGGREVKRDH